MLIMPGTGLIKNGIAYPPWSSRAKLAQINTIAGLWHNPIQ